MNWDGVGVIQIKCLKNQRVIADQCIVAVRFHERFLGLMGRADLPQGEGMLFPRCNSVHMWFMRIPIDVIFLKKRGEDQWEICSLREDVRPWRLFPLMDIRATDTLELPSGTIGKGDLQVGDLLCSS